ncbi:substrate-binding domain-containing protein [Bryobacter aggregatus]|uniref:substrate-binding domain-containing protein n=1 Tax=Bryobacter aggregatus TaxID=360054 RepID=UPI0004E1C21E|nr:substrate-binding domain-containing protein [Bryobacter aggregatus]
MRVENRLSQIRKSRGVTATELSRRVEVSRQTIYAIEAGTYVPNTELALNLARELEVTVDELFSLAGAAPKSPETFAAEVLSATSVSKGQPMRICQVGTRWVSVPVSATPYYLPEADGIVKAPAKSAAKADLLVFEKQEASQKRLILAGCDPATGLLSRMVERISGVEIVSAPASSKLALTWLTEGKVHIAGSHLEDAKSGEFNLPFLRNEYPNEDFLVVTFARWEEGLVVASGNPKNINRIDDLARKNVKFINREPGSGSRGLLEQLLEKAGIPQAKVRGFDRIAYGHLAAAYCVLSLDADVCLATRSAAQTFGLDFIPLHSERYDLVMRRRTGELPAVKAFLDVLQRATLRRKLEVLAGYDTTETGALVA